MVDNKNNISSFSQWNPRDYLRDYYSTVQEDEKATIKFLVDTFRKQKNNQLMLEFGSGPTLHHVFAATPYVSEIHMADYLQSNLDEVHTWVEDKEGRHSWWDFVKYTLQCEGVKEPTNKQILERKNQTRKKITKYLLVNAAQSDPAGKDFRGVYPLVLSCYCADSATSDKKVWFKYMKNIMSHISKGGTFITAALRKAKQYKVGNRYFPSANIDEYDLAKALELDFSYGDTKIKIARLKQHDSQGYSSILFGYATLKK